MSVEMFNKLILKKEHCGKNHWLNDWKKFQSSIKNSWLKFRFSHTVLQGELLILALEKKYFQMFSR